MDSNAPIRGLRIRVVNFAMLLLSLLIFAAVIYATSEISRHYEASMEAMNNYMNWEAASRSIQYGTDYLTDQAKIYAATQNKRYAENYCRELYEIRNRENALEKLIEANLHSKSREHDCELREAVALSNVLAHREIYAMRLVAEGSHADISEFPPAIRQTRLTGADRSLPPEKKIERAREMLYDINYEGAKKDIHNLIAHFINSNIEKLRGIQERQAKELGDDLRLERALIFALLVLNVLIFAMIIFLVIRPLKIFMERVREDKKLLPVGAYEFKHLARVYNEIFSVKEYHDKMLKHKAEHDPLTGLLNRSAFDSLQELLAGPGNNIGLLLADVDKFKDINDAYGHMIGDETLRSVANMLLSNFRSDDYCIRLGGDEFAVIFPGADESVIPGVIEKIKSINDALSRPKGELPPVSISVGGAISQVGFAESLYQRADEALYKVKEEGRRGCQFYKAPEGSESK